MTLALAVSWPEVRPFARVDLDESADAWRELEAGGGPYQGRGFAAAHAAAFGAPLVTVVARDSAGAAVALLALQTRSIGPAKVASLAGGAWSNYHMGLFRPGVEWSCDDVVALLKAAGAQAGVDLFAFSNLPALWDGRVPPLSLLPGSPAPSPAFATALQADPAAWLDARMSKASQKKLRKKARKLEDMRYARGGADDEGRRYLEAFFAHKAAQAKAREMRDLFADPRVRELLVSLLAQGTMEMHALLAGDRVAATLGALTHAGRLSGLVISYDGAPEIAAASPGEWLVIEAARDAAARGLRCLDLGVGDARYKRELCEIEEALHDAVFPVTALGRIAGAAWLGGRAAKGWIKRQPRLFRWVQRVARTYG